jgi:hypothetical protein
MINIVAKVNDKPTPINMSEPNPFLRLNPNMAVNEDDQNNINIPTKK